MKEPTLAEQIAAMEDLAACHLPERNPTAEAILSTLRKFAEVERDARRYLFLRNNLNTPGPLVVCMADHNDEWLYGEKLDAAIDSAMPGEG